MRPRHFADIDFLNRHSEDMIDLSVYDKNKQYRQIRSLWICNERFYGCSKDEYWTKKRTQRIPAHYDENKPKFYEPETRKMELAAFEKQEYAPLDELINSKIAAWKQSRDNKRAQFADNIFSNQQNLDIILEKIDTLIAELEKEKTELNRLHSLYAEK